MAKIQFELGDTFSFKDGKGVVIADNVAVLVTNEDMRSGSTVKVGYIPSDALPAEVGKMKYETQMIFKGAMVALGIEKYDYE